MVKARLDVCQEHNVKYVQIFWPAISYITLFIVYCLLVNDFYKGRHFFDFELLIVSLIGCWYVFPGIGAIQFVCGIIQMKKSRQSNYKLHLYSSLAVLGVFGAFLLSLSFGNYPSV